MLETAHWLILLIKLHLNPQCFSLNLKEVSSAGTFLIVIFVDWESIWQNVRSTGLPKRLTLQEEWLEKQPLYYHRLWDAQWLLHRLEFHHVLLNAWKFSLRKYFLMTKVVISNFQLSNACTTQSPLCLIYSRRRLMWSRLMFFFSFFLFLPTPPFSPCEGRQPTL